MRTRHIISIQGGQAVGKTTLARALQRRYSALHVEFENPYPLVDQRKALGLDLTTEAGFVANQRLFIAAECQRFKALPDGPVLLDRGPEDIECFTLHYPHSMGKTWDIEPQLAEELAALRQCRSDQILYLKANPAILSVRKESDTSRARRGFKHHLEQLYSLEEAWFLALPQTRYLEVDALTAAQVEQQVAEWLETEWQTQTDPPNQQSDSSRLRTESPKNRLE